MFYKNNKITIVLLWGTGVFTLQTFMSNPATRPQILISILIAYMIYSANQLLISDYIIKHKILKYMMPLVIMNGILIPINVLFGWMNGCTFKEITFQNGFGYLLFNVFVLIINIIQHHAYKKRINMQLKLKLTQLK